MKKALSVLLFLPLALHALAGRTPVPEAVQQARLVRFKPAVTKALNPDLTDTEFLTAIARDTWGYFRDVVDKENGIPLDNVLVTPTHTKVMSYTSTTNVGLYLMSLTAAQDLGFITPAQGEARARKAIDTLKKLSRWEGQFFNYYETITLNPSSKFVSSVDNGWLAAGLVVAAQAYPPLREDAEALLEDLDFSKLYDADAGQLYVGYESDKRALSKNHYGLLCTEPRLSSYIGIAKGDLPKSHWYRVYRTLPADWTWQNQIPRGVSRAVDGIDVFYGFYRHDNLRFVPSWGGSLLNF
ncbi:MAG: DUF3131 domain-containing protein [Elusimicrobia bacterium]|nr:DUF3131 domain-containing protein [Elusimicrobiota bacterium]